MDIEMPVMDGLAAVRQIRKYEEEGTYRFHLPVIGVSANARMEQQQGMIIAGKYGTLSRHMTLIARVRNGFDRLEAFQHVEAVGHSRKFVSWSAAVCTEHRCEYIEIQSKDRS